MEDWDYCHEQRAGRLSMLTMIKMSLIKVAVKNILKPKWKIRAAETTKPRNSQQRRISALLQDPSPPICVTLNWTQPRAAAGSSRAFPRLWEGQEHSRRAREQRCRCAPTPRASQSRCERQWRAQHRSWGCCLGPVGATKTELGSQEKKMSAVYSAYRKDSYTNLVQSLMDHPKTVLQTNFTVNPWLSPWEQCGPAQSLFCPHSFLQCFWNLTAHWNSQMEQMQLHQFWGLRPQFPGFCTPSYCLCWWCMIWGMPIFIS